MKPVFIFFLFTHEFNQWTENLNTREKSNTMKAKQEFQELSNVNLFLSILQEAADELAWWRWGVTAWETSKYTTTPHCLTADMNTCHPRVHFATDGEQGTFSSLFLLFDCTTQSCSYKNYIITHEQQAY